MTIVYSLSQAPGPGATAVCTWTGVYSVNMGFWWYCEWPEEIKKHSLMFVRSNEHGQIVSINVLEYVGMLINYAAATRFYRRYPDASDPFPKVLFFADNNTAAES